MLTGLMFSMTASKININVLTLSELIASSPALMEKVQRVESRGGNEEYYKRKKQLQRQSK